MNQTLFLRRGAYRLEIISAPRGWGTYTGKHPATGENLGVLSGKCLAAVKLSLQDLCEATIRRKRFAVE